MKKVIALLAALLMILSVTGCGRSYKSNNKDIAVTVGDFEVSYDFLSYFYRMYKQQGEEYGVTYTHEELMNLAIGGIKEIAATLAMAEKYSVKVGKEDIEAIHDYIAEIKDGYDKESEFYDALKENFMSEQVMYDIQYYGQLEADLREILMKSASVIDTTDKALDKAIEEEFMAAVNILIFKDTEADGLCGKELADSIYAKIISGGDIYKLAEQYSEDSYCGDRYFAPGTVHEYFEEKVGSMEIGELSEVYESEIGYNITKRVAIDKEFVNKYYEELRSELALSRYVSIMNETAKNLRVTFAEDFDPSLI